MDTLDIEKFHLCSKEGVEFLKFLLSIYSIQGCIKYCCTEFIEFQQNQKGLLRMFSD